GRDSQLQAPGHARRAGRHPRPAGADPLQAHSLQRRRHEMGDRLRAALRPRPLPHARRHPRAQQSGFRQMAGHGAEGGHQHRFMINTKDTAARYADQPSVWLRRFTKLTAFSAVSLLFAGAQVTSTGSWLAVPDWPLSYGMFSPPMIGGIFYEHGHRIVAGIFGLLP